MGRLLLPAAYRQRQVRRALLPFLLSTLADADWQSKADAGIQSKADALGPGLRALFLVGPTTLRRAGAGVSENILKWDMKSTWTKLGAADGSVWCACIHGGKLYIGGQFATINGLGSYSDLAMWDGAAWHDLGGANNAVYGLLSWGNYLVASGAFSVIGGVACSRIAKWDGVNWSPIGAGHPGGVGYQVIANGPSGLLTAVDLVGPRSWDGSNWTTFGNGIDPPWGPAWWNYYAIGLIGSTPYIGGIFTLGAPVYEYVARWDGGAWVSIGNTDQQVSWLTPYNGLAMMGAFLNAGGANSYHAAEYSGAAWTRYGTTLNSWGRKALADGGDLYVCGDFTAPSNSLARWNGVWNAIAGVQGGGYGLCIGALAP